MLRAQDNVKSDSIRDFRESHFFDGLLLVVVGLLRRRCRRSREGAARDQLLAGLARAFADGELLEGFAQVVDRRLWRDDRGRLVFASEELALGNVVAAV